MLCEYKNIFGEPNTGLHKIRIFDIAIVDVVATIIVGILLSKYYKSNLGITLFILFALGIIIHYIFCVRTTVDKMIFNKN